MEITKPQEFFDKVLPAKFDPNKAVGLDAIIQMNIAGPNGGDWFVTVKDQKIDIKHGIHPSPSISITMADTDYVDMINGKLGAERAFMTGKLKFKGNIALGLKLKDIGFM
jgi:putative sterol carrier protein